jgi:cyclomaltodextrinase
MSSFPCHLARVALRTRLLFIVIQLFFSSHLFSQTNDSLRLTFRYADPVHQKVRVFVPGDFNNWGPNSNGVIAAGAPSLMMYDSAAGIWRKTVLCKVGATNYYKYHFHLNADGSNWLWVADPLNPVTDGTQFQNSLVTITDPMIFEAVRDTDSTAAITGTSAGISGTRKIAAIAVITPHDSLDAFTSLDTLTGLFHYAFPSPLAAGTPVIISVTDSTGRSMRYQIGSAPGAEIPTVPAWAADAVWYQLFPERFRNGDPANDPNRMSLETPGSIPLSWRISPWTGDWYARDAWEVAAGPGFYSSVFDRRYGGDLQGVLDKLGYLDSLGINALYFNPIFWARSLHKYDGDAYQHVDPFFGPDPRGDSIMIAQETLDSATWHWTAADTMFLRVVRSAHQRGMKVILDGVWDHTGRDFFAFKDLVKKQKNSSYKDWYTVYTWYDSAVPGSQFTYKSWWGYVSLPEFATTPDATNLAPGPKQHIFTVTRRWMDPNGDGDPSDGIDGWRLDTVPDVPIGFWTEWNTLVRAINPQAYTTAEVWSDATYAIQEGKFSGTMNYAACMMPVYDCLVRNAMAPGDFLRAISSYLARYGNDVSFANQNLADSHDTERLASMIVNGPQSTGFGSINSPNGHPAYLLRKPNARERAIQQLALLAQVTLPGAPMIYYGDEAGMWGAGDPDDRMPMTWPDRHVVPQATDPRGGVRTPDDMNFDSSVFHRYQSAIGLRRTSPSLKRGDFQQLAMDDTGNAFAFSRSLSGETMIVAMNRIDHTTVLSIPTAILPQNSLFKMAYSTAPDSAPAGFTFVSGAMHITLPAIAGAVIRVVPDVPMSVPHSAGWSLVSVPVDVHDWRAKTIFPAGISPLFAYDGGYKSIDTLRPGAGYWLNLGSDQISSFSGGWRAENTVPVRKGWNLIGGISAPLSAGSITSVPGGMITSPCYSYSGAYQVADTIRPGEGYWIRTNSDGVLICSQRSSAAGTIHMTDQTETPPPPPAGGGTSGRFLPKEYALDQNYPNPFNPSTRISYALPFKSRVMIEIYSLLGEKVVTLLDGTEEAGYYSLPWSPAGATGLYFCRFSATPADRPAQQVAIIKKMIYLK